MKKFSKKQKSILKIKTEYSKSDRGRHSSDRMQLDLQLPVQSVPITTNVLSMKPVHGEVYLI